MPVLDRAIIFRETLKSVLAAMWKWRPLHDPVEGYSIVIGVPWALRELVRVNLTFIQKCNLEGLDQIILVFDRAQQPGGAEFMDTIRADYSDLPLEMFFQPTMSGKYVRMINKSHFYANLNWTMGVAKCRAKYAILHDFDLYPVEPNMFSAIYETMKRKELHFSGLVDRMDKHWWDVIDPPTIGSCELGIDVEWIRSNAKAIDCFHKLVMIKGQRCNLDSFNYVQLRTDKRALAEGATEDSFVHVWNLCSTYLKYSNGQPFRIAWRLHSLWYLQSVSGMPEKLEEVTRAMGEATSPTITIDGIASDFSDVHVTCADVLSTRVSTMDEALHGAVRPEVTAYLDGFRDFLDRYGDNKPIEDGAYPIGLDGV